jgi:putative CRISPR-associated protein (TIGR02619 family)
MLLLSTCGTSVLTNDADDETRHWLNTITNQVKLNDLDDRRLTAHVADRRERLQNADAVLRAKLSAELNGIGAVFKRWPSNRVQHLLVHTDTAVGRAAAELVKGILERDSEHVQFLSAAGLRTDDLPSFREALSDLTSQIEQWIPAQNKEQATIFNLTGGFKSLNGYLQALGMLYADRRVFFFEGAPELMEIPRLPVRISDEDEVRRHSTLFRRLALGYAVDVEDTRDIPDALLLVDGGKATTSVWGDVVWQRFRKKLLGEALQEPLSPKLTLTPPILKAFGGLQVDRRIQVNDALDNLSAHLDDVRHLLKSNSLKKLEGKPVPDSTHEMYLWSDASAWRLFGHFEHGGFVADSLACHL